MTRKQRYTQAELINRLRKHGLSKARGGRHQVKTTKEGRRPITIPQFRRQTLPVGLSEAILKQAEVEDD